MSRDLQDPSEGGVLNDHASGHVAIGHGKHAAHGIDAFLSGREADVPARHDLASFELLNTWYYSDTPRTR